MKKLQIAVVACLMSAATYAQGTFDFNNLGATQGIWLQGQVGTVGPGAAGKGQLFYNGSALTPVISFYDVDGATHWAVPASFTVPGAVPGSQGTITAQFWTGLQFDTMAAARDAFQNYGEATFTTTFGGPDPAGGPAIPAGTAATFSGLELQVVPEPSVIALAVLGAGALLFRRRK